MRKNRLWVVQGAIFSALFWVQVQAHASCASTTCAVNSDWDQGVQQAPGFALDLRYEFIDQNQLREGSNKTSIGAGEALETRTVNRVLRSTLEYNVDKNWGVAVSLPLLKRNHSHILNDTQEVESWDYSRSGDVRVVGRYQPTLGSFQTLAYGFNLGVKLPTGATGVVNDSGITAERTLQPGSGSTDILVGAYLSQALPDGSGRIFLQSLLQHALRTYDQFTPGDQYAFDIGFNYKVSDRWGTLLQLNAVHRERDTGINAETDLSGGRYVFISPGVNYLVGEHSQVYGFIQQPLYQYVNGTQLTAELSVVVGLRHRF